MADFDSMETLEFPVDPSTLPTTTELPLGELLLQIKAIKIAKTKESDGSINERTGRPKIGNKKCVNVQFAVVEPEEYRGIPHTKMFLIGSDEDPNALKPMTWKRNATLLMAMFKAAKVGGASMAEYIAAATDGIVGADVRVEKSKDARYSDKHTPKAFWEPGKKMVRVVEEQGGGDVEAPLPTLDIPVFNMKD